MSQTPLNSELQNKLKPIRARFEYLDENDSRYYISLAYGNHSNENSIKPFGQRITGVENFDKAINTLVNKLFADFIIITEYNGTSPQCKPIGDTIKLIVNQNTPGSSINYNTEASAQDHEQTQQNLSGMSGLNGLDGINQIFEAKKSQLDAEFDLRLKGSQINELQSKIEQLTRDKEELDKENDELFADNEKLQREVQRLRKFDPKELKVLGVPATGLLAEATKSIVAGFIKNKPDKVKAIIGEQSFNSLSGLFLEDENQDVETSIQQPIQEVNQIGNQGRNNKTKQDEVAEFWALQIKQLNREQLQKIHVVLLSMYDEQSKTINDEKLEAYFQIATLKAEEGAENKE